MGYRKTGVLLVIGLWLGFLGCGKDGNSRPVEFLEAEGALGPYSAVVDTGDAVYVAGKIGHVRDGSFTDEAASAIDAIERELKRVGLTLAHVVSATVYLNDMRLYGELNGVYAQRFSRPYPARVCLAVKELPRQARVEIQVIARR